MTCLVNPGWQVCGVGVVDAKDTNGEEAARAGSQPAGDLSDRSRRVWGAGHVLCVGPIPHSLPLCPEKFNQHIISYHDLAKNPSLLDDPNLVVKINGK